MAAHIRQRSTVTTNVCLGSRVAVHIYVGFTFFGDQWWLLVYDRD